jgi:hypothetical protein
MYSSALFLFSALDGAGGQLHELAPIHRDGIPVFILFGGPWPKSATEILATSPCWRGPRCGSQPVLIGQ